MPHEQSETIQGRDKRWYNVYGPGTGATQPLPLPRVFGFEQGSYETPERAANAAAWRSRMGEGQYPTQPPSYGFTESYKANPQAQALGKVIEALQDPRNSWIGMGPLSAIMRPAGWGAEVLRRYKLLGGTPETLNRTLANRAYTQDLRNEVVSNFRKATDIAAPPHNPIFSYDLPGGVRLPQDAAMHTAGSGLEFGGRGPAMETDPNVLRFAGTTHPIGPSLSRMYEQAGLARPTMESQTAGNAAYGALSRQVARMLDQPGFQFSKPVDLPQVSDKAYLGEFPIEGEATRFNAISQQLRSLGAGEHARPNVRRPRPRSTE